jgi:Histidine kinase-, DNA gyrase B-, and HSP90-like ATPase
VPFYENGKVTDVIDVEITYQIIGLFSEGLYSSANKAIEELVSNSFDADATAVELSVSRDLDGPDSTIAVFDNGSGMDQAGLKTLWIVGDSIKRRNRTTPGGRQTIGKFGIGKLAAYVLGTRLTHISKSDGVYLSTTMDFGSIPATVHVGGVEGRAAEAGQKTVQLDLRVLTEAEARRALQPWLKSDGAVGRLRLFGANASPSWTAAVISGLKPMATELSFGRLRWILATAMPLRDDFTLRLNGGPVESAKLADRKVGSWILGKDLKDVPRPGPSELEAEEDPDIKEPDYRHWMLIDKSLGPVTGYVEVYADPIDAGKSAELIGRSNGFFVYVQGRLINPDDAGFGIDRNTLRHGTFSRFRVVVNIDRLDEELRSSRESLRDGPRLTNARQLLQGLFNFARSELEEHEATVDSGRQVSQRFADSPASLSERPILRLILESFETGRHARHIDLTGAAQLGSVESLKNHIEERIRSDAGLIASVQFADLGTDRPIAILQAMDGVLTINLEHPFVAHFADAFNDTRKNLPLQLFAVSEVALEAQLRASGATDIDVDTVLSERDELLRHLARSRGRQNSMTVAQDLLNAASDKHGLELALVAAFNQLGYEAIPRGGNNNPDGIADAHLPPSDGQPGKYRVSLEAKSKETPGGKVKKAAVEVSTIARHRHDSSANYAIVVGPRFETGILHDAAVVQEIDADRGANPGKSITLMNIEDLARLVRAAPLKRISLARLRGLFAARTPTEASQWVDAQLALQPPEAPYRAILETVWSEQQNDSSYSVTYSSLRTALRLTKNVVVQEDELRNDCIALARMAPTLFVERAEAVELNTKPDKVLEAIRDYIGWEAESGPSMTQAVPSEQVREKLPRTRRRRQSSS